MSITIKEIARLAGTSRGTVDRVINKRGGVQKELEEKINRIIKEHNYEINKYARGLVSLSKQYKIGLVITSLGNEFYDLVLLGINKTMANYSNITLIVKELKGYDEDNFIKNIKEVIAEDIDILILTPIDTPKITNYLETIKIPIIAMNNRIELKDSAFVGCDYINSGKISGNLANLILDKDSNVLIVGGSFKLIGHRQRVNGFQQVLIDEDFKHEYTIIENEDDENISYEVVKKALKEKTIDLIYFCAAGIKGGLKAVKELDIKPQIITVDETTTVVHELRTGFISATITQQPYKQGSLAIEMAANHLIYGSPIEGVAEITGNIVKLKNSYFGYSFLDQQDK